MTVVLGCPTPPVVVLAYDGTPLGVLVDGIRGTLVPDLRRGLENGWLDAVDAGGRWWLLHMVVTHESAKFPWLWSKAVRALTWRSQEAQFSVDAVKMAILNAATWSDIMEKLHDNMSHEFIEAAFQGVVSWSGIAGFLMSESCVGVILDVDWTRSH